MKPCILWILSLSAVLSFADAPAARGDNESAALASHDALAKRLNDPKLRLLDARPKEDYDKGHIPGAVWVDAKGASAIASKPGGLTDRDAWAAWIKPLGLSAETEVLAYAGDNPLEAARVWWLLRYLGVERAGIVNGGFPLWRSQGRPVSTKAATVEAKAFPIRFQRDRLATREDVIKAMRSGQVAIVDARSAGEYDGSVKSSKRGGHVPAACRVEWSDLIDKQGRFLSDDVLRAKFAGAGIVLKPKAPAITHCQGGGRASVDAFVLERLGLATRNYYSGWSDWGNAEEVEAPAVIGDKPGARP